MAPTSCSRVVYLDKVFLIFVTFLSLAFFNFDCNSTKIFLDFGFFLAQVNAFIGSLLGSLNFNKNEIN